MNTNKLKGHAAVLTANVIFGLNIPVIKFLLSGWMSPLGYMLSRTAVATLCFWAALFLREPISRQKVTGVALVITKRKGASSAQIALAWLLAQKPFIVPIPGMDKLEYLDDNIASTELTLTPEDLQEIEDGLSKIEIHGARLSQALLDDIHEDIK